MGMPVAAVRAYAAGGAIFSGPAATIESSVFSGNTVQGGSSAAGGTAGRGLRRERRAGGHLFRRRGLPDRRRAPWRIACS